MMENVEAQLKEIVGEYDVALSRSKYDDASDVLELHEVADLRTRCIAAIVRATNIDSTYHKAAKEFAEKRDHDWNKLKREVGVVKALLNDIERGYLTTLHELIHGDVFSDYLEMAEHLVGQKYKDAAAVLVGATLEIHIRELCKKHGINVVRNTRPRSTDGLNAELAKTNVYSKLDQKNVTAWLGLRNSAAHGNYSEYTFDQVRLYVQSIRDFITRFPA